MRFADKTKSIQFITLLLLALSVFSGVYAAENNELQPVAETENTAASVEAITNESIGTDQDVPVVLVENSGPEADIQTVTVNYSGTEEDIQTITVDYSDDWLLQPDDIYNHKLMQASFALAVAGFRDKTKDISQRDFNILDFFAQAGYVEPRTIDFDIIPSIDTIGTAIAHKTIGDETLLAVSISGNNYQGEWAGNLTIDDDNRVKGFNDAADKVTERLERYIRDHDLHGNLRLWTAGYSRSAAVTNDFAADAVESGLYEAVYAYTFATPRTTREENADRYHNIFNLLNPFDMVPMAPFPEWGFHRYGIDLFFPAIETDSRWFMLKENVYLNDFLPSGEEIVLNPQISKYLHTLFDYLAFFIKSANSYKTHVQDPLVEFIQTRDLRTLLQDISKHISFDTIREYFLRRDEITRYQMHEFYNFLDFITRFVYTSAIGQNDENAANIYWDPRISVQENLAFNHYDKTYRAWLFSTDNPGLLTREANYAHVVIRGDVDVDVFDKDLNFIVHVYNDFDSFSYGVDEVLMPGYEGVDSETVVYFERQHGQTLLILPLDQIFHVGIYSQKDQTIQVSYVEFSADKLQADLRYIYLDDYDEGEYYVETFDPEKEREYTTEELQEMGVLVVEPWSKQIVYSPTAIMRLENEDIPHPSPKILLIIIGLILVLIIILFVLLIIVICKLVKKLLKKSSNRSVSYTD